MRTTLRLDDSLLQQARLEAKRRGMSLDSLVGQGLRLVLGPPTVRSDLNLVSLPECRAGGGVLPGVNLNDPANLLELMEDRD